VNQLTSYLLISSVLAALGIVTIVSRRNAVAILMGIELLLNAAALNFVAFGRFTRRATSVLLDGQIFAIFIIVLAAAEAVIILAVIIALYRQVESIDADRLRRLKG